MNESVQAENTDAILTLKDVAVYLKLAERTVYLYAQTGKLPGIKIGSAWRFRRAEIETWLDEKRRLTHAATTDKRAAPKTPAEEAP
jgi:excisionase family DNA binding protein